MKPPPLLLGATLLFWGWQTEFLLPGALMGVIIESARVFKARWELSDEDFGRVWTLCALLLLASALYAFTANEGPSSYAGLFEDANLAAQRKASLSSATTIVSVMRWLPMIFFPFLVAQTFSVRDAVPLATIAQILQLRWKTPRHPAPPRPPAPPVNLGFTYFSGALFAASFHPAASPSFFWGVTLLITWALWSQRSRRFALPVWLGALGAAVALGYLGQQGIGQLQRYLEYVNPQWIARFLRRSTDFRQSKTALGRVGELKLSDTILIRVEPRKHQDAPAYLRDASYRLYHNQVWSAGTSRNDFQRVDEDPPLESASWTLLPRRTHLATLNIACYLDDFEDGLPTGLLPLPTGTARLEQLRAYLLRTNSAGAVLAQGPRLLIFDALHAPGATIDSPPDVGTRTAEDLEVQSTEEAALDRVIAELKADRDQLSTDSNQLSTTLRTLATFFNDRFRYRLWQPRPEARSQGGRQTPDPSPLSRFLLQDRAGHCEYFATATVLLLRRLGIPARYATGYMVHEKSGTGYVVRASDAHAWTLVWDAGQQTWLDFDTTPASWIQDEAKNQSPLRWLSDAWSRLRFELAKLRWGQSHLRQYLLWITLPGLLLLLYQIIFRRGRRRLKAVSSQPSAIASPPPGLDSEFYQVEKELARRGVPRQASEPLSEWLKNEEGRMKKAAATVVRAGEIDHSSFIIFHSALLLHYRYRFDPVGLSAGEREALREQTRACLRGLKADG